jgi:transcriptional regulator of acetoin/glycerol metabolism
MRYERNSGPKQSVFMAPIPGMAKTAQDHGPGILSEAREKLEKRMLSQALKETHYNISETARRLGICRPTVYRLIRKYRLEQA